jgi:hypothetical protein
MPPKKKPKSVTPTREPIKIPEPNNHLSTVLSKEAKDTLEHGILPSTTLIVWKVMAKILEARLFHQFFVLGWDTLEQNRGGHMVLACNLMQCSSCAMIVLLVCKAFDLSCTSVFAMDYGLYDDKSLEMYDQANVEHLKGQRSSSWVQTCRELRDKFKNRQPPKPARGEGRRSSARDYQGWRQYNAGEADVAINLLRTQAKERKKNQRVSTPQRTTTSPLTLSPLSSSLPSRPSAITGTTVITATTTTTATTATIDTTKKTVSPAYPGR